jgi:hypothetical protein
MGSAGIYLPLLVKRFRMNPSERITFDGDSGLFSESVRQACTFLDYSHPAPFHAEIDALQGLAGYDHYAEDANRGWRGRLQEALFRRLFWRQMLVNQALAARLRLLQGNPDPTKPLLVFIVPHDATQALMGGSARNHEMARFLSQWFHVKLIAFTTPFKNPQVIPMGPDFEILAFPVSRARIRNKGGQRKGPGLAAQFVALMDEIRKAPFLLPYLREIAPQTSVVLLSSPFPFPAVNEVLSGIPIIYETMDVTADYVSMVDGKKDAESVAQIVEVERLLMREAQLIVGVAARDIEVMKVNFGVPDGKFLLVPNGVNVGQRFCSVPSLSRELRHSFGVDRPIVLFVGSPMRANIDAATYIRNELAPALPQALFVVLGLRARDLGQEKVPNNLIFTGPLPDNSRLKEAIFLLAEIAIAPMIHGTGSSLKIPDYLAHGKLLVATEIGARGHDALHPYVRLATREGFKVALGDMLARLDAAPTVFDAQARAAREKVRETLDWSVVCAPLASAMRRIMRFGNKETTI